jgi:acetyl-CoA carboxylase biotin carboxyl carrier protein
VATKKQPKQPKQAKQPGGEKQPKAAKGGASGAIDVLKQLVQLLDDSSVSTIKLQLGDASYEVSRGPAGFMPPPMTIHTHGPSASAPSGPSAPSAPAEVAAPKSNFVEIKSPMVGTFYRAPEPGADPYVKPGSRVSVGQTLCIIEAMKIMNEIESEVSGVVRDVLVEDAQPVEFGQVLFRVEPNV